MSGFARAAAELSRALIHGIAWFVLVATLAPAGSAMAAFIGGALGCLSGAKLARTTLRTPAILLAATVLLCLVVWLDSAFTQGSALAGAVGPVSALRIATTFAALLTAAIVSGALRACSKRRSIFGVFELLLVAVAFTQLFIPHRHGAINRPFYLADWIIALGWDPTWLFLFVGGTATALGFDVSDWAATRASLERLLEAEGAMDIVVHNAGITDDAAFPGMDYSQWQKVIDTSLNGFFHVTRPLLMPMIRQRWGRIVSIASIAALHGNRGQANYAAAKAGVIGASRSLAREVASRGICVNVVAPGFVDTGMIADIPAETIKALVPMQRSGRADEIAAVVGFLCSDDTAYMTGEVLNVSGGII